MKKQSLEFKIENIEKEDVKQNLYTETDILNRRESYKYSIENNNEAGDLNNNIEQLKDWFELR